MLMCPKNDNYKECKHYHKELPIGSRCQIDSKGGYCSIRQNQSTIENDPYYFDMIQDIKEGRENLLIEEFQNTYDNFFENYDDGNGGKKKVYSKFQRTSTWEQAKTFFIIRKFSSEFNSNGIIICDECNKPIYKNNEREMIIEQYICDLHHNFDGKIDYVYYKWEDLFNPKYIRIVHHRCHKKIHGYFD